MDQAAAEAERKRMAKEHPEATWLLAERADGVWEVVRVDLKPADLPEKGVVEAKPRPPHPADGRSIVDRQVGGPWGGGG